MTHEDLKALWYKLQSAMELIDDVRREINMEALRTYKLSILADGLKDGKTPAENWAAMHFAMTDRRAKLRDNAKKKKAEAIAYREYAEEQRSEGRLLHFGGADWADAVATLLLAEAAAIEREIDDMAGESRPTQFGDAAISQGADAYDELKAEEREQRAKDAEALRVASGRFEP